MKTRSKNTQRWGAMTAAELAEATKEFDRPLPASRYRAATKAERARFERARRAGMRAADSIGGLNLNSKLLTEAKAYAKRKNLTWSQLLERGLRRELAVKD